MNVVFELRGRPEVGYNVALHSKCMLLIGHEQWKEVHVVRSAKSPSAISEIAGCVAVRRQEVLAQSLHRTRECLPAIRANDCGFTDVPAAIVVVPHAVDNSFAVHVRLGLGQLENAVHVVCPAPALKSFAVHGVCNVWFQDPANWSKPPS